MTTTSIAWTPGTWHAHGVSIHSDMICPHIKGYRAIALVKTTKAHPRDDAETQANARLMGAAPDLYAALDRLVNHDMSKEAWEQAHAALTLARGETNE